MVRRYYVSTEWQLKAMLQEFSSLSYLGFVGNTGGYWIFRYNGMYEGIIGDIYLHCLHAIGDLVYVSAIVNGTEPQPPQPPQPQPLQPEDTNADLEIYFTLQNAPSDPDATSQNIFSAISQHISGKNYGYVVRYVYVEGNVLIVGVQRTGSITLIVLAVIILALIIGTVWSKIINYKAVSLNTNNTLITERDANVDYLVKQITEAVVKGDLTQEEATALISNIKSVYTDASLPTDKDNNAVNTGLSITTLVIGGIAIYLFSKQR